MAAGTALGLEARPYYDAGNLVPDRIVIGMILQRLRALGGAQGIILDGFPRNRAQAEALDRALADLSQSINAAIYLDVPRELLVDRLLNRYGCEAHGHVWTLKTNPPRIPGICDVDGSRLIHRSDDVPEKIVHRLDIFFSETIHLVDYFGAQHKLVHVDGNRDIASVNGAIFAGLHALLPAQIPAAPPAR